MGQLERLVLREPVVVQLVLREPVVVQPGQPELRVLQEPGALALGLLVTAAGTGPEMPMVSVAVLPEELLVSGGLVVPVVASEVLLSEILGAAVQQTHPYCILLAHRALRLALQEHPVLHRGIGVHCS